jgi:type II secretion system protein H
MGGAVRSVGCESLPVVDSQLEARSSKLRHPVVDSQLAARSSKLHARSAFTLLELILVLMVVGLGASLAAARLSGMRGTVGVDMAAQSLVDQARRCQHLAATSGQAVRLRLDLTERVLHIALLDGAREQAPTDGESGTITLAQSVDNLTVTFARGDAVKGDKTESTIDLLFTPDQRCDPAGTVTFTSPVRSASVRLSAGARLPALVADTTVTP